MDGRKLVPQRGHVLAFAKLNGRALDVAVHRQAAVAGLHIINLGVLQFRQTRGSQRYGPVAHKIALITQAAPTWIALRPHDRFLIDSGDEMPTRRRRREEGSDRRSLCQNLAAHARTGRPLSCVVPIARVRDRSKRKHLRQTGEGGKNQLGQL